MQLEFHTFHQSDYALNQRFQCERGGLHAWRRNPPKPTAVGTVFLWPGLQPLSTSTNYDPINNGVLQPNQLTPYSSWWESAMYVNTFGSAAGFTGCQNGGVMAVDPGVNWICI